MPKYRALVALVYPTDPAIIARLLAGENLAWRDRYCKQVAVGEIVDDLPECSREGFLAKGKIELVSEPTGTPRATKEVRGSRAERTDGEEG